MARRARVAIMRGFLLFQTYLNVDRHTLATAKGNRCVGVESRLTSLCRERGRPSRHDGWAGRRCVCGLSVGEGGGVPSIA